MKKTILSILSVAFIFTVALAQPPQHGKNGGKGGPPPSEKGKQKMQKHKLPFGKELNLSAEQKEKAKAIGKEFHEKVQKLKADDNISMGEFKKRLASLEKERKSKMDALLTTEQKTKLEEMKKKRAENMQVKSAAHLERMKIDLNLTEEQTAKVKKLQQDLNNKLKALHENDNIASIEKKDKVKAIMDEHKEAVKKILTKEQQVKMEARKDRKPFGEREKRK